MDLKYVSNALSLFLFIKLHYMPCLYFSLYCFFCCMQVCIGFFPTPSSLSGMYLIEKVSNFMTLLFSFYYNHYRLSRLLFTSYIVKRVES